MKQKRKYHELSDDDTKSPLLAANTPNEHKRAKMSLSSHEEQICDTEEEEEVWVLRLPRHLNPNQLHNEKVSIKLTYLFLHLNSKVFTILDFYFKFDLSF